MNTENNKLIAEFMGYRMNEKGENDYAKTFLIDTDGKRFAQLSALKFHTSWDWLMPVVEKIGNTKMEALGTTFTCFPYQIRDRYFLIHCHDGKRQDGVIYQTPYGKSEPDTITAVYKGVIAFIIFVNTGRLQLDGAIERYFKQQKNPHP